MRIAEALRKIFAREEKLLTPVAPVSGIGGGSGGWWRILEPFAGAWQRNIEEKVATVVCYPTLYACLNRISTDIGKLPFRLMQLDRYGLWRETTNPAYSPVLRYPNSYQTPAQFREAWILSKLQHGNTYVLKERDDRGVVNRLYVLDPSCVTPLVAESGGVYYQLNLSTANNLLPADYPAAQLVVPAREIIHDRLNCFHHQLIGVPPLCAAHWPTVKNLKILKDATQFFANGAQPGGILTAPAGLSDDDAEAIKAYWQANFTGENRGKVGVIGADMKFTPFAFKSVDSQMVEQMRYSDEQICQPFGIPPFKIGIGSIPAGLKVDDLNQLYYADALQAHIEAMEDCLDRGLGIGEGLGVELNLEPLLRMDAQKQADVEGSLVKNGIKAPNEARRRFGLVPLEGGDSVYLQQQNYSMEALARRDRSPDPFGTGPAPAAPEKAGKVRARYNSEDGTWDLLPAPVTKRLHLQMECVEKLLQPDGKRILRGIATTNSIDRMGDIVEPRGGSWKLPVPLLWAHDHTSPIGWVREAVASDKGVTVVCEVAKGIGRADEVWAMAEAGLVSCFSIGFRGLDSEPIPTGWRYKRWELLELSVVVVPAQADAIITDTKVAA